MLALKITAAKIFMHQLLIGDVFNDFSLSEASITTFNHFHIDGKLHMDFFDTDTAQQLTENGDMYSSWKDIKPYCYSIIRGKLPPLQFKLVMHLFPEQAGRLHINDDPSVFGDNISDLFLNIQYRNEELLCTTGVFSRVFSLDKAPESAWDNMILDFFRKYQIDFIIL